MADDLGADESTPAMTLHDASLVFTTPAAYADDRRLHRAFALLRREEPVLRVEREGWPSFWALTRHADVLRVATDSETFHNAPSPVLQTLAQEAYQREHDYPATLLHMDGRHHKRLRDLTVDWFKPRRLARLEPELAAIARATVDDLAATGGEADFAGLVAMPYPLRVILAILGLPDSDHPEVLELTHKLFGRDDPVWSSDTTPEALQEAFSQFLEYFGELMKARQDDPGEDVASVIANGDRHGTAISEGEKLWYAVLIATAGHDTTSAAIAGGIEALIEHPDQLGRLRRDPELVTTAADEMIRWVSPVKHFMRTATARVTLSGRTIERGEMVLLSYPSANRDETVFDVADTFDVGRNPNRHLGFGFGAHYCLGATLARLEIKALLRELVPRLHSIELAGPAELIHTTFVGGYRRVPTRFEIST